MNFSLAQFLPFTKRFTAIGGFGRFEAETIMIL